MRHAGNRCAEPQALLFIEQRTLSSGIRLTSTTSAGLLRFSFICAMRSVPPASSRLRHLTRDKRSMASCKLFRRSVFELAHANSPCF